MQQTWYTGDVVPFDSAEDGSDSSGSESSHSAPEEDLVLVTESGQLNLIVSDAVASLLKLSIVIQKSSRQAKFARSSREKQYDTRFDILHVQESFPFAANNHALVEKLGKANAQRRQWIAYRRRHHEKLSAHDDTTGGPMNDTPSHPSPDLDSKSERWTNRASNIVSIRGPQVSTLADDSTVATTFYEESQVPRQERNEEEDASEISYSVSSFSGSDKEQVRVPRPPPESANGKPFECPFCFTILSVESMESWM